MAIVDISWIKLKTKMFDDEKILLIESMPERDAILIIWIRLLIQAGKTNANGYIFLNEKVPYTPEMLSSIFRRPLNTIKLALKTLSDLDMIEFDKSGRILINNWTKHQSVNELEKIRENNRRRVAKFREKQKKLKPSLINKDLEKDIDGDIDSNITVTLQDNINKLWIKNFGRNPKQPEFEETEQLIDKFGIERIAETFREAALRNIKSLRYLIDNLDTEGKLKKYEARNGTNKGIDKPDSARKDFGERLKSSKYKYV